MAVAQPQHCLLLCQVPGKDAGAGRIMQGACTGAHRGAAVRQSWCSHATQRNSGSRYFINGALEDLRRMHSTSDQCCNPSGPDHADETTCRLENGLTFGCQAVKSIPAAG